MAPAAASVCSIKATGILIQILMLIGLLFECAIGSVSNETVPFNIFILAGQSNMGGQGGIVSGVWNGIVPSECQPNPAILKLSGNYTWEEAKEPLHKGIDGNRPCGIGPGMPFANTLLHKDPYIGIIGLVPCAKGGSNISVWQPGTFLYERLIDRTRFAVKSGGTIKALLWYQGESETNYASDAHNYKEKLENFLNNVRQDLSSQLFPIIQVAITSGNSSRPDLIELVRKTQLETRLPNVWCLDPRGKGLTFNADHLHLTTESQVKLGEMLAEKFLQIPPHSVPYYTP